MKHDVVAELKRLAAELGHAPSRREWETHATISKNQIYREFGSYSVAIQAAGLSNAALPEKAPTAAELFTKDLHAHLLDHFAKGPLHRGLAPGARIAIAGDMHLPFICGPTLAAFYAYIEVFQPDVIVQCGDLYDMFAASKFPKSLNVYTPRQEFDLARDLAEKFWAMCRKLCPKARLVQLLGNHDIRPIRRVIEKCPEAEIFIQTDFARAFQFEGVESYLDPREEIRIGEIIFQHGHYSGNGKHRDFNVASTVVGHTHTGGVTYRNYNNRVLFELNVGYMADPTSKCLGYTTQRRTLWTQGFGVIDEYGPRFIAA